MQVFWGVWVNKKCIKWFREKKSSDFYLLGLNCGNTRGGEVKKHEIPEGDLQDIRDVRVEATRQMYEKLDWMKETKIKKDQSFLVKSAIKGKREIAEKRVNMPLGYAFDDEINFYIKALEAEIL